MAVSVKNGSVAAWQCARRDHYIGWDSQSRQRHLNFITNNSRFLLLPLAPQLASHLLSQIARQLSHHWQRKYGHPVYLLESFVQRDRFLGAARNLRPFDQQDAA